MPHAGGILNAPPPLVEAAVRKRPLGPYADDPLADAPDRVPEKVRPSGRALEQRVGGEQVLVDCRRQLLREQLAPLDTLGGMLRFWRTRMASLAGRYADAAPAVPACCNACRTCVTTNIAGLITGGVIAAGAVVWRLTGRIARSS
jgi:hypothetical protein